MSTRSVAERIRELEELRKQLHVPDPEKAREQHARGKLLARERLERLLDPNTFSEIAFYAKTRLLQDKTFPGDGVVAGYGRINGRPVYVFAQDFTVMGGSIGEAHGEKIARTIELAMKSGVPVIGLWDSGGARIQEGVGALHAVGRILSTVVHASGVIPQIAVMLGPSAGGAAYAPALMDFTIMAEQSSYMFITGPNVVKEVTGEEVSFEELGGAKVHATISGVAHFRVKTEDEAFELVRRLLSYLPDNFEAPLPILDTGDPPERLVPELDTVIPDDPMKPYDMHNVIDMVFDSNTFLEVQPEWGQSIIVGFARLGGVPVCVVASQPLVASGAIDINASVKTARFVRFCDSFNLPILTFVDVPGYLPGRGQEHGGIIRHGAKMIYAYTEATVPKITVIVRKAYGGAYIAMGSRSMGADIVFAWPTAEVAVTGARAAVQVLYRKQLAAAENRDELEKKLVEDYVEKMLNPYKAAELGLVDDVIKPSETRIKLYHALTILLSKRDYGRPRKKHGNIPL